MRANGFGIDRRLRLVVGLAVLALLAVVALPAFAAGSATAPEDRAAPNAQASEKPGKGPKVKVEKEPVTLRGEVTAATDADGNVEYRMSSGGKTWTLDAGPAWFHGDNHPLKAFVGKTVTITGDVAAGSTDVDVDAVDGTALRGAGKPAWAGGWKRVGEAHPGWSEEKAARWAEKAERMKAKFGDCFPPGQCKKAETAD
jgi:hypothetical protein